ncbi:hypothetical protein DL93DRAFT_2164007 [Clavulina sp. PMI_390]|nr:hypothetical protein DL93DRAFT_2164007 [Clavulina sp. PMI_390]
MSEYFSSSTIQALEGSLVTLLSTPLPQPDAQHLLKTSHDRRASHAKTLEDEIAEVDLSIQSVLAISNQIGAFLRRLQSRRSTLVHALQSPIYALPAEMLKSVFETVAREDTLVSSLHAAIVLSHVCSAWRDIVLTTPNLWSAAKVSRTDALSEIVKRSRPLPLDLSVTCAPIIQRSSQGTMYIKHLPWEVRLEDQDMRRLTSFHVEGLSLLEHLVIPNDCIPSNLNYIGFTRKYSVKDECSIPTAFRTSRAVEFNIWSLGPRIDVIRGSWPRMEWLIIRNCSSLVADAILDAVETPLLERIEFCAMERSTLVNPSFQPKTGVHSVRLSDSAQFAGQFRAWIHKFPSLRSLGLDLTPNDMSSGWWNLLRSCTTVNDLVIFYPPTSVGDWIFLAEALDGAESLPNLCSLRIEISTLSSEAAGFKPPVSQLVKGNFGSEAQRIREAFVSALTARISQHRCPTFERLSLPREIAGDGLPQFLHLTGEFIVV